MALKLSQIAMSLKLQVPMDAVERHVAASPLVVGNEIARQMHDHVKQQQLGYYPALDYFQEQAGIDKELISALENITWVVTGIVRNEVLRTMRPVFSKIHFEAIQTIAFTMPTVRPTQKDALEQLARHFTADVVKVSIIATLIQHFQDEAFAETMAEGLAHRWLQGTFTQVDVSGVRFLSG